MSTLMRRLGDLHWPAGWLERTGINRNPVSPTRQRIGLITLLIILLGIGWYSWTTRDAGIRKRAEAFLREITSGEVHVGAAQFKMFGGITLADVQISTPFDARLDPAAREPAQREIFSAKSLQLIHSPWLLLLGRLDVEEIIAVQPRITLVQNVENGIRNWQLLARASTEKMPNPKNLARPDIRVRSARAVVVSIQQDGSKLKRTEELDADIRPHPTSKSGYYIEIRGYTEPAERVTVLFDPASRLVTNTPFVDARTIRLQLPKAAQQFFDAIRLSGDVKLNRLIYDPTGTSEDTEIRLRRVQCEIPLSLMRSGPAAEKPSSSQPLDSYIHINDVEGRVKLRGGKLEVQVTGKVNGGDCQINGFLENVGGPLELMGIDLSIVGKSVPAPEGQMRRALIDDPSVPEDLRIILVDYNPFGNFDFNFKLARASNSNRKIRMAGTLEPRIARATSRLFPYPIDQLTGRVRFDGDRAYIENLRGRHGPAEITFNGTVDKSTPAASVSVDIRANDVPLDRTLLDALSRRHQHAWRRFTPQGDIDLLVKLRRAGSEQQHPPPPFQTHVSATLDNESISLKEASYWLNDVSGRLEMDEDRIEFHDVRGKHDEGSIIIEGYATIPESSEPEMDLCIEGRHIRLDDELMSLLPPDGRGALAPFQPFAYLDATGSIQRVGESPDITYDLYTSVYEGQLAYAPFPYQISSVHGDIHINPQGVSILQLQGSHGPATINVRGDVVRHDAGYSADLTFGCAELQIDRELYDAFPESLRNVWRMFEPQGTAQLNSVLHFEADENGKRHRHRTHLTVQNGSATFRGFPIPLHNISAEIDLSDQLAEITRLTASSGGGSFSLNGTVDIADHPSGTFNLAATDFTYDDALHQALPESVRNTLKGIKPAGRFDLQLHPLSFEPDRSGHWNWMFAGQMQLKDFSLDIGMELRKASGLLSGNGSISATGSAGLDLTARLGSARCAGWDLQDVNARIVLPSDSSKLEVRDALASAYGGELTGFATVDLLNDFNSYQASITAREVLLDKYLEQSSASTPQKGATRNEMQHAQGKISGNMFIRGRTGPAGYREGAGEMYIRSAQMWKLPLVFAIFQVLNLAPDENVFHDGRLKYYLQGEQLVFNEIDLQGKAVSFLGGGRMDLRSKAMDVTLLAGSPIRLRIPMLTDILETASREFMEVRIRGTLGEPKIEPQPLKSLKKTLETLFPPPPQPRGTPQQTVLPDARKSSE